MKKSEIQTSQQTEDSHRTHKIVMENDQDGKYGINLEELNALMELRGAHVAQCVELKYGGTENLCKLLSTNSTEGLNESAQQLEHRRQFFGSNLITAKPPKSFLTLMWEAIQDVTLIVLICAAAFSLLLSIYVKYSNMGHDETEVKYGWIEGVAILAAVVVVVFVTAINDWQKERQFRGLQDKIESDHKISVMRAGAPQLILVSDIVVGDICQVKYGDLLPADGIIIQSNDLKVDESSLTGESLLIKKGIPYDVMLMSGTHVMEGAGRMLVTAVGLHSQAGSILAMLEAAVTAAAKDKKKNKKSPPEVAGAPAGRGGAASDSKQPMGDALAMTPLNQSDNNKMTNQQSNSDNNKEKNDKNNKKKKNGKDGEEKEEAGKHAGEGRGKKVSVLQSKLNKLAAKIGQIGTVIAVFTVLIMIIKFCIIQFYQRGVAWETTKHVKMIVNYVIIGVTVLVVAVPEGLPLAVTISLAFSVKKMMKDNNLVRHLDACETMGNATAICSDKTGTLTTNRMTVVQAHLAATHYDSPDKLPSQRDLPPMVAEKLARNISINSSYTSRLETGKLAGQLPSQIGNKTECALLGFLNGALSSPSTRGESRGGDDNILSYQSIRTQWPETELLKIFTFNSERKSMSTVVREADSADGVQGSLCVYTKGASEMVLNRCSYALDVRGEPTPFSKSEHTLMRQQVIERMANHGLRTIALAYRQFVFGPATKPGQVSVTQTPNLNNEADLISQMTLIGLVGIEDPVRPEVPAAIQRCQNAGITVRMVTGDNVATARSIARKCGIISPNAAAISGGPDDATLGVEVMEGAEFNRQVRDPKSGRIRQELVDAIWPRLRVLARSSPKDKYTLVSGIIDSHLTRTREVVAVTGDGTNDGPALKKADVGFAMGIAGTDVAKQSSDIILTDDNFTSIVKAVMWGRNVYDSIAKFLQFQLTVNLVAVFVAFLGACFITDSPLKAVQMLWVNLIMDTLASLALATESPTEELLERKPYGRTKPIVSATMIKNIVGQGVYQISVLLYLLFCGSGLLRVPSAVGNADKEISGPTEHFTVIFNAFVMMTLFNEFNARKIHGQHNIFAGLRGSLLFVIIWISTFIGQILIVQFGGYAVSTCALDAAQWLWCIFFGMGTLLWSQMLNLIPDSALSQIGRLCCSCCPARARRGGASSDRGGAQIGSNLEAGSALEDVERGGTSPSAGVTDQHGENAGDDSGETMQLSSVGGGSGDDSTEERAALLMRRPPPLHQTAGQMTLDKLLSLEDVAEAQRNGRLLWMRGANRILTQIRIVHHFRSAVMDRRSLSSLHTSLKTWGSRDRFIPYVDESEPNTPLSQSYYDCSAAMTSTSSASSHNSAPGYTNTHTHTSTGGNVVEEEETTPSTQ